MIVNVDMKSLVKSFSGWRCILVWIVLLMVSGCATGAREAFHSFSFNGWSDKWAGQVDLLEYSYGDQYYMVRRKARSDETTLGYGTGVTGLMPIADFLYVKWRIKATGEVVEDRADLRGVLPSDMKDHGVTFVIDGRQLYVYLVTPKAKRTEEPPPLRTYLSSYTETYEIYPANTLKR